MSCYIKSLSVHISAHFPLLQGSFVFAEQLIALISAAKQHDIEFIYAISPGLDITFSNPREVATLKKKLDQVGPQQFCHLLKLIETVGQHSLLDIS